MPLSLTTLVSDALMTDIANRGALGFKKAREGNDPKRLDAVRALPCCICYEYGLPQLSPTAAHHCIHGRYSTRKAPDSMAIPLCEGHHQGLWDTSKIALHQRPSLWKKSYGMDTDWISWTEERLK